MSDIITDRHAQLGCMVLRLFPKVMQMILRHYETPPGLKQKCKHNFNFVLTDNEIVLMDKLPNMDEFTIEICFKILRYETRIDAPKSKWGNVPHDTEVELSDDIQRLINATNSILRINPEELTEAYFDNMMEEIKLIVTRIDSFLEGDVSKSLYNNLRSSETDSTSILQDLTKIKAIDEAEFLPDTESENRERYSRLAMAVIDTFPNILRNVMSSKISVDDLFQQCMNYIDDFKPDQQAIIQQLQNSNKYSSLDVTLIYRLLRQFKLILPPPTKGWGNFPDIADTTLANDIERIRIYRNQIAHRCDTNIDANEFDEYFDKFQNIGRRIDQILFHNTNFEQEMIRNRTCRMDTELQKRYENKMKEMEHMRWRFENWPIQFYWGDSFDKSLKHLRALFKHENYEGRQTIRLQIIFQTKDEEQRNIIDILNSLKDEINEGLRGIEFIVATKGSVVLNINIIQEMLETDDKLQTTLAAFLEKILELITTCTTDTIDMVLLPVEEFTEWNVLKTTRETVYLEFQIEAKLLQTEEKVEEQLGKISDAIFKDSKGSRTSYTVTAALLPFSFENVPKKKKDSSNLKHHRNVQKKEEGFFQSETPQENVPKKKEGFFQSETPQENVQKKEEGFFQSETPQENVPKKKEGFFQSETPQEKISTTEESFVQAQTPVKCTFPVSINLRQKLDIHTNSKQFIYSCIKIGKTLVFADFSMCRLIICNADGTDILHISLSYNPQYIIEVDSNTVAVSFSARKICIINISTGSVTSTINTSNDCFGLSYDDNNLYVVIDRSTLQYPDTLDNYLQVIDLTGKVIRTIPLPTSDIHDIKIHKDRLVCISKSSIYSCSLDGKVMWKFENDVYQLLHRVTTDDEGNVYVTDYNTNTVVSISDDGKQFIELITEADGLNRPFAIYFDKIDNLLLVFNHNDGKGFLFDAKMKQK